MKTHTKTKMLLNTSSLAMTSSINDSSANSASALTLIDSLPSLIGTMGNETETASLLFTESNRFAEFLSVGS